MKLTSLVFIAATLTAGAAFAQSAMDPVVADLTNQGYTNILVQQVGNTYKVEATLNGAKREIVYDATTGKIISDRVDTNGDGVVDATVAGVGGAFEDNAIGAGEANEAGNDNGMEGSENGMENVSPRTGFSGSSSHDSHSSNSHDSHRSNGGGENEGGSDND